MDNILATINVSLPSDGETADAADLNTPINTIVNEINGNLDNDNIDASAGISGSKLADNSIDLTAKASNFDGWVEVTDSWSYASSTTITVPSDATTKYQVGDRIKLDQSSTTKYFTITAVSSTVITLIGEDSATVANSAITNIYYSKVASPQGWDGQWMTWTPSYTNLTVGNGTVTYKKYIQIGKTVHFKYLLVFGSTSAVSGDLKISLPVAAHADYGDTNTEPIGAGSLSDTGTAVYDANIFIADASNMIVRAKGAASTYVTSSTPLSATVPFTWTTNDRLELSGTYEAA